MFNLFALQTNGFSVLTRYTFDNFVIKFQNNVLRTYIVVFFVFVHIYITILNNQTGRKQLFNVCQWLLYIKIMWG